MRSWLGGELDIARAACEQVVVRSDAAARDELNPGLAYLKLGRTREARSRSDRAIALSPNEPLFLFARDVASARSGEIANARADGQAAEARGGAMADDNIYGLKYPW